MLPFIVWILIFSYFIYLSITVSKLFVIIAMVAGVRLAYLIGPLLAGELGKKAGAIYLGTNTQDKSAYYSQATAFKNQRKYDLALNKFEEIREQHPEDIAIYMEMLTILINEKNDLNSAETLYKKGINSLLSNPSKQEKLTKIYRELSQKK